MTSSIVASSCIKVSRQRDFHWLQRPKCSFILFVKCLLLVNHDRCSSFSVMRLRDGLASRHLSASLAIHVYSLNVRNWVEVRLLPSIPYLFSSNISEFLTNTAPPASDSVYLIYQQNFTAKKLFLFCFVFFLTYCFYLLAGFNLFVLLPIYAFSRCCDKRISGSNNNLIKK